MGLIKLEIIFSKKLKIIDIDNIFKRFSLNEHMNIVIFTDTFLPNTNGVVSSIVFQIEELAKKGHNILVVTAGKGKAYPHKNIKILRHNGITIPTYKDYQLIFPTYRKTMDVLKKFKPDVFHIHTPFGIGWEGIISAKRLNIPVIGTHHTFFEDYTKYLLLVDMKFTQKLSDWYTKLFFNYCDIITSPSMALLKGLKKIGITKKLVKVPNGINISKFKKKKDFKKKHQVKKAIMYMGRVAYEKSIDVVIESMVFVQKKYPEAELFIVGEGPEMKKLKELAKKLNVKTQFTGIKKGQEFLDWLYSGDIFVTASASENQPMSILEAMGCGRALVGVNARGVPELIVNNKNGLIAKPHNPKDLSKKIIEILENPPLKRKFEKESLKMIKSYSTKLIVKKWEELYHQAISSKKLK